MKVYQLKARLNNLQLAGYSNGELQWIGTNEQWSKANIEEEDYKLGDKCWACLKVNCTCDEEYQEWVDNNID